MSAAVLSPSANIVLVNNFCVAYSVSKSKKTVIKTQMLH